MLDRILRTIKKIIPRPIFEFFQPAYHYFLSYSGALIYGFPSKKMFVIGVTGTKGKTTTSNIIAHILNEASCKTGLATTVNFKIGDKEMKNPWKQTMGGRFKLQKLLKQMVDAGCKYAVVETSSEGIVQYRHRFIDYDAAVFTNLSPEHLERHKSFENYRSAKVKLFEKVAEKKNGIGIYNLDDESVGYFLRPKIVKKFGFTIAKRPSSGSETADLPDIISVPEEEVQSVKISDIVFSPKDTKFKINGYDFKINLLGKFNVYNAAAAVCVGLSQEIEVEKIAQALQNFKSVSGRMEVVDEGQNFCVVVDYAHEPKSLESVYKAVGESGLIKKDKKMICILGSAGGGRDKWKRPQMGKIAARYCDKIILTNEDPYDENPDAILKEVESGFLQEPNFKSQMLNKNYWKIIDRRQAIEKAYELAQEGDAVVMTGKGGEVWMCVEGGKKIPWDEKKIATELLRKIRIRQ